MKRRRYQAKFVTKSWRSDHSDLESGFAKSGIPAEVALREKLAPFSIKYENSPSVWVRFVELFEIWSSYETHGGRSLHKTPDAAINSATEEIEKGEKIIVKFGDLITSHRKK